MINRSDIDERITKCNKILEDNPNSQIFAALADAYRKKGEIDRAFRICQNGLKIHPNYGSAHLVMAKINMDKGLYDWAETEVEKAIEIDGATRATELLLSEIYIYKGEFNKACRLLEKLHQGDPDNDQITKLLDIARKIPLDAAHSGGSLPFRAEVRPAAPAMPPLSSEKTDDSPQPATAVAEETEPPPSVFPEVELPDLDFKQVLKAMNNTPGVEGTLVVNTDGLVVEAEWNVPRETDLFAALTQESARNCSQQMRDSGFGSLESMMIETGGELIYLVAAKGKLLAVVCTQSVNLGSLKLKLSTLLPRLSA